MAYQGRHYKQVHHIPRGHSKTPNDFALPYPEVLREPDDPTIVYLPEA